MTLAVGRAENFASVTEHHEIKAYRLDIRIDAPPEFLFPYLIEEDKVARWNQDPTVTVSFPRGTEPRIGKLIKVELRAPTDPWLLMELRRLETGRVVLTAFVDGVLDGDFAYYLQGEGPAATHLVHEMRIRPKGALVAIVWEIYGKHLHRQKMRRFMANMKEVVEADYQASRAR
jgi:hypothetical protein